MKHHVPCLILLLFAIPMVMAGVAIMKPTRPAMEHVAVATSTSDFVRGPTVNLVTNTTALIFWETAESLNSTVRYGTDLFLGSISCNATATTEHRVVLDGLLPGTVYHYKVLSGAMESKRGRRRGFFDRLFKRNS